MSTPVTVHVPVTGSSAGATVALDRDRLVLGRDAGCDVPVPDAAASREHCAVVRSGDGWTLSDLGARNATRHNGRRLAGSAALTAGDRIRIGTTELEFSASDATGTRLIGVAGAEIGRAHV